MLYLYIFILHLQGSDSVQNRTDRMKSYKLLYRVWYGLSGGGKEGLIYSCLTVSGEDSEEGVVSPRDPAPAPGSQ